MVSYGFRAEGIINKYMNKLVRIKLLLFVNDNLAEHENLNLNHKTV